LRLDWGASNFVRGKGGLEVQGAGGRGLSREKGRGDPKKGVPGGPLNLRKGETARIGRMAG